jgi:hypothetical protein
VRASAAFVGLRYNAVLARPAQRFGLELGRRLEQGAAAARLVHNRRLASATRRIPGCSGFFTLIQASVIGWDPFLLGVIQFVRCSAWICSRQYAIAAFEAPSRRSKPR